VVACRDGEWIGRDRVAALTGVPAPTLSRILARHRRPALALLDPVAGMVIRGSRSTAVRYERPVGISDGMAPRLWLMRSRTCGPRRGDLLSSWSVSSCQACAIFILATRGISGVQCDSPAASSAVIAASRCLSEYNMRAG